MNEAIQQARVDLAAALRLAERFGLHEGICNHFSYALPGRDDRFLLNPYGTHWSQVTASGLQLVDGAGQVLEGDGAAEVSAFSIHAPIHQRHPRARAVFHTHMPYATSLTSLEDGRLEPVTQNALRFHGDVAYDDDYNGVAEDTAEGERMAGVLGGNRVLFLAHHGVIVVGETIPRPSTTSTTWSAPARCRSSPCRPAGRSSASAITWPARSSSAGAARTAATPRPTSTP
jgi:ribulose-5-phosphate 4-epimerase/fuculose-1-phosphate aldolase